MPRVEATRAVAVSKDIAFAVSQTHGPVRLLWDPFIHRQRLIDARAPARGVRTETVSRHRLKMVSEYVSFRAPDQVGMKMGEGLAPVADRIGVWLLGRDIDARISAWARACTNPEVLRSIAPPSETPSETTSDPETRDE